MNAASSAGILRDTAATAGRDHLRVWGTSLVALSFVGLALLLRAPALLYSVINFDESLYLLIGDELRRGILPFTHLCDRKPFGLFALFALFALKDFPIGQRGGR